MNSISFVNAYWLIIAIPLIVIIVIPFVIAVRKENVNCHNVISLISHILIAALVAFALAGTAVTTVMTETQVYVLADVSYSAEKNLDTIDGYIKNINSTLPRNSELGIIAFGRDYKLICGLGDSIKSVKNSGVDGSATDLNSALDYAATLFDDDAIKRIVLITDGRQTAADANQTLITKVENLYRRGIYVDAVYVDGNLPEGATEVQISSAVYTASTYINREESVNALIESSFDTRAVVTLSKNGVTAEQVATDLIVGSNVVNFKLDTSEPGDYEYRVTVRANSDTLSVNNEYSFVQSVSADVNVLLISSLPDDVDAVQSMYGGQANVQAYINTAQVPYRVEELIAYDEIIVSNVDVRELDNFTTFVNSLDTVVSLYGKSLITVGDTFIQNHDDDVLKDFEDMLPVRFGNSDQDPKLYGLVIDTSRSMVNAANMVMPKQAAISLMGLMRDGDYLTIISFAGEANVIQNVEELTEENRAEITQLINDIQPTQGTFIGTGLSMAMNEMLPFASQFGEMQVMLISDGLSYSGENIDPVAVAAEMAANGIKTSVINTQSAGGVIPLREIAKAGAGEEGESPDYLYDNYFYCESLETLEELIITEVANQITDSVIQCESPVYVQRPYDSVMDGVSSLPTISGYVYGRAKASALTVLTTEYVKSSGGIVDVPLYSYWNYGNGKVSVFCSNLSGDWISNWAQSSSAVSFLGNVALTNMPDEKHDCPFTMTVESDGSSVRVEIEPSSLLAASSAEIKITTPDSEQTTAAMIFDSRCFYYEFITPSVGGYKIEVTYNFDNETYTAERNLSVSYFSEYDCFASFDAAALNMAVANRGTVSEDGNFRIVNDDNMIATYSLSLTLPLLIAAAVLFVADVIIRKLKWNDIIGIFRQIK